MKTIHYVLFLALSACFCAANVMLEENSPAAVSKPKTPEYFGLVDWSQLHAKKEFFDNKSILLDGFLGVRIHNSLVQSVKIFESKEALEYNRDLMFININTDSFVAITTKAGILEPSDLESMDGSYVQISGLFSSTVPVDNMLGIMDNIERISIGGGGRGRYYPKSLILTK